MVKKIFFRLYEAWLRFLDLDPRLKPWATSIICFADFKKSQAGRLCYFNKINPCNPMNRSLVKRLIRIFLLFFCTSFFTLPKAASCSDRRPYENGPLKSSSEYGRRRRAGRSGRPQLNKLNAANITECVIQTPIRADHIGRYIRLNTDGLPFSAT